ncbi:MAG: carboxyl-terminal processing protease [Flavobacteriaceae bacterium]|jgi:carboxyl-terminal processing protease
MNIKAISAALKISLWSLLFLTLVLSCAKDDAPTPVIPVEPTPVSKDVTAHNFMWKAMNLWYFWQSDVADLADNRFATDKLYSAYLQAQGEPDDFYNDKLLFSEDRFSFLNADYKELVQSFQGISKSNGLEFGLSLFSGTENVYGYVRYIVPGSNAATVDISRGEIFTGVDGKTLNLENYQELLFGPNDSYTLNMASIENNTITPNGKSVNLTKEANLSENPVFLTRVIETGGQKTGYIMYNGFTSNYNEQLNQAFGSLKSAGVTDLVMDMRYNPGGSVNTSRLLASMIYGTDTNKLYIRQRWNSKIQPQLSSSQLEDYFANSTGQTPINSLGLSRVFVIATGSSASASELVMNGLDPYMEVIHIGTTTRGKNEFSITLVDIPSNSFIYDSTKESGINSKNLWGIQPLVGRNENANGFFDYTTGFTPDYELREVLSNYGILGNPTEPLLAKALSLITGNTNKAVNYDLKNEFQLNEFDNSKRHSPLKERMILDKNIDLIVE